MDCTRYLKLFSNRNHRVSICPKRTFALFCLEMILSKNGILKVTISKFWKEHFNSQAFLFKQLVTMKDLQSMLLSTCY